MEFAQGKQAKASGAAGGDDEDDYMTMAIPEPTRKESSVQRAARLKRESRERGFVKSKAQQAEEATRAREKALSTSLFDAPRTQQSKGLAMMAKMGFTGGGLGKKGGPGDEAGITEPIGISKKADRGGIGLDAQRKRQLEESGEAAQRAAKAIRTTDDLDPAEYRERMSRERLTEKLERQLVAAQRLALRLDEEEEGAGDGAGGSAGGSARAVGDGSKAQRHLKSYPKQYRGYMRQRREQERKRQNLARLAAFNDDDDDDQDDDDRTALGKSSTEYVDTDEPDESDEELEVFDRLGAEERLRSVLEYVREKHRYCLWCKAAYPDEAMDGCPGLMEDDHD